MHTKYGRNRNLCFSSSSKCVSYTISVTYLDNYFKKETGPVKLVASSGHTINHSINDSEDLYIKFKKLQKQLEFLQVQEDYIKDELKNLRTEYLYAQEEVKRIQSVPLVIGQFLEAVDQNYAIVGKTYYIV